MKTLQNTGALVLALGLVTIGCNSNKETSEVAKDAVQDAGEARMEATKAVAAAAKDTTTDAAEMKNLTKEQAANKTLSVMKELVAAAKSHDGNCPAMGQAMTGVTEKNKFYFAAAKAMSDNDPSVKKWFDENYGVKTKAVSGELVAAIQACTKDPGVARALASLGN